MTILAYALPVHGSANNTRHYFTKALLSDQTVTIRSSSDPKSGSSSA